jgi:ribosomal protein S18 acetylase RimI-like enzyme
LAVKDPGLFAALSAVAKRELASLSSLYPGFDDWYRSKVEPGLLTGERKILLRYSGSALAGIAILKTAEEIKLCCLRVLPGFHGSGVGPRLFNDAFEVLGSARPLLSVANEQLPAFKKIFDHFGFQTGAEYVDLYRPSSTEYSFNGTLLLPTTAAEVARHDGSTPTASGSSSPLGNKQRTRN